MKRVISVEIVENGWLVHCHDPYTGHMRRFIGSEIPETLEIVARLMAEPEPETPYSPGIGIQAMPQEAIARGLK